MGKLFTIPFAALIRWHTPRFLYSDFWKELVEAFTAGVAVIKADLLAYRSNVEYLLQFSGSKIYLEHWLNDLYDPIIRGITIENGVFINPTYLYNKVENRLQYLYNRYDAGTQYITNEYCSEGGKVYKALQDGQGNQPSVSPLYWEEISDATYLHNKAEFGELIHFYVILPAHMNLTNSLRLKIRGSVDKFNVATKNYQIKKA